MKRKLLKPQNVCLQIIDVQQNLMAKINNAERVIDTVTLLIKSATILSVPIIANTQYKKGLGPYVEAIDTLIDDSCQIDKVEFSAAKNSKTSGALSNLPSDVNTIALVGVETHICIYQTALTLLDMGYAVWVVTDGVSSRYDSDHREGLSMIESAGGWLGSSEMLLYELMGKAGTPEFKQVLSHIVTRNRT